MDQQIVESSRSLSIDVETAARPTDLESHVNASILTGELNKSKKKKKKNRRKSLEKSEVETIKEELQTKKEEEEDKTIELQGEVYIEEMAVAIETSITETGGDSYEEEEAKDDELEHVSLDLTSSLDTIKSSGTQAVGSLLSKLKLGHKKSLSSGTESATKIELVNVSPVETAGKRLKAPEEMISDNLSTRMKRDRVDEGDQSVQASTKNDKIDVLEEQGKHEKDAMQTLPSTAKSSDGVPTQVERKAEESEVADSLVHLSSIDTAEPDGRDLSGSTDADCKIDVSSDSVTEHMVEVDVRAVPALVDDNGSAVTAVETLKHETSITLESNGSIDEQVITTEVQDENALAFAAISTGESTEKNQRSADVVMIAPVPLKLGLDTAQSTDTTQNQVKVEVTENASLESNEAAAETFVTDVVEVVEAVASNGESEVVAVELLVADMVGTAASNENAQSETVVTDETVVNPSVTESVKVVESNEYSRIKATSTDKTELLAVKVTPPTSELPVVVAASAKQERMSPVKSLASRFEGKHEQSLDSLKFRTVREFFPEERSIRVGAEKKKYEAQAQQQKLKAKAEEEAKAKYKAGLGFRSPEKEAVLGASSLELKNSALIVQESVVTGAGRADPVVLATPDITASRTKFSFDERNAADSRSKSSDNVQESLTPVKSIASRFEGKHEQSLDNLKFRTVREFFPDEEKRSIHVGAEKAKFEALRKQQEEAMMTAEHVKLKAAALLPIPTIEKRESSVEASSVDASVKPSLLTFDEACNEMTTSATLISSETKNGAAVESANDNAKVVAVVGLSTDVEPGTALEKSLKLSCILPSTSTDMSSIAVIKEDKLAFPDVQGQVKELMDTAVAESVSVGSSNFEVTMEVNGTIKLDQEAGKGVSIINTRLVELDPGDVNRCAGVKSTEEFHANEHVSLNIEENAKNAKSEEVQDIEFKIGSGLDKLSLGEAVVNKSAEFDGGVIEKGDVDEQVNLLQAPSSQNPVQVAKEKAGNSELIELNLGEPVEGVQVGSSVSSIGEFTIAGGESESVDIQQSAISNEASTGSQDQVPNSASSELDLSGFAVEASKEPMEYETKTNSGPIFTTERLFVMEDDHTIETVETVVVGERPMTDGEDDNERLSPTKVRPAHEIFSGILSSKSKKTLIKKTSAKASAKLTRKVSVEPSKSTPAKPTVPIAAKRASITAPTASCMAKKALKANELHKVSPQFKKKGSASEFKSTVCNTGFVKPASAASIVPAPMKRASVIERTTSSQARNVSEFAGEVGHSLSASTTHVSKPKGVAGRTGFIKPSSPTIPVASTRGSIGAPTASYRAKKGSEHLQDFDIVAPSIPVRNKKYTNVKSKVLAGIEIVTHKTITKEEFIAAERRKSLGSAGVRSVLGAVDRRASLAARATIDGPPEPFVRSAQSRKKLNSTLPRYMNYENTPGYAERARQQYERRKRLEEKNAAKSEKRQRELRVFFADKQQTSLMSSTNEVHHGLEVEIADQKALRAERRRTGLTRSYRRAPSATSSAGTSSSHGVPSRTSKKSSVSSVAEMVVTAPALETANGE